jgi:glycosyltransferase involved in cell wall biosynthesis
MDNEVKVLLHLKGDAKRALYLTRYAWRRRLARHATALKLTRVDDRTVPLDQLEIRLFMVARNESLRLPFMIEHYFRRGVDRIFVVDNDSTDDTPSIVLSHDKTHLYRTGDNFANKAVWLDLLLRQYGRGCWCVVVDADEVLLYPGYENVTLREFCDFLCRRGYDALHCVLLDMYPRGALDRVEYEPGRDPLAMAPWFDRVSDVGGGSETSYGVEENLLYQGPSRLMGGMRRRVFGITPYLSKFPLVRFRRRIYLSVGTHSIEGARISKMRGALLHFKYLQDFAVNVRREITREQYWHNASEYKIYGAVMDESSNFEIWYPGSEKFENSAQLVRLGIMRSSLDFERDIQRCQ